MLSVQTWSYIVNMFYYFFILYFSNVYLYTLSLDYLTSDCFKVELPKSYTTRCCYTKRPTTPSLTQLYSVIVSRNSKVMKRNWLQ